MQMEVEHYHIDFKRSGGFSGDSTGVEIDSRELSIVDSEVLKLLIDRSGFFEAFISGSTFMNIPDQFRYHITIEHMGKRRTLDLNDGSIPEPFRPLVNYLVRMARVQKDRLQGD